MLKQVSSVIFDLILLGWFQDIINAPWCNDAMTGCIAIATFAGYQSSESFPRRRKADWVIYRFMIIVIQIRKQTQSKTIEAKSKGK